MRIPGALFLFLTTAALASNVGDTLSKVLEERGEPISRLSAGDVVVLHYSDVSIRLRNDVVVEVKKSADAQVSVVHNETRARSAARRAVTIQGWTTDAKAALESGMNSNRNVFLFFTGSDWCGWCKRLNSEILSTPEFLAFAEDNLVLLELDFPRRTTQPDELKVQNAKLRDYFKVTGYPTVVVLNPKGEVVSRLGYQQGGPKPFIDRLRAAAH